MKTFKIEISGKKIKGKIDIAPSQLKKLLSLKLKGKGLVLVVVKDGISVRLRVKDYLVE